jgi:hypothetical protein
METRAPYWFRHSDIRISYFVILELALFRSCGQEFRPLKRTLQNLFVWSLVIRASNLIRHSNFVIRILQWYIDQEFEFDSLRSRRKQLALDGAELGADAGVEQAVFDAQDNSADD